MLEVLKVIRPGLPNHRFNQAVDLSLVATILDNGQIFDLYMENGEKIQMEREGRDFHQFVEKCDDAKHKRYSRQA